MLYGDRTYVLRNIDSGISYNMRIICLLSSSNGSLFSKWEFALFSSWKKFDKKLFGRLEAFRYFYELFKRKALLCCPAVPKMVEGRLLMENRCSVVFNLFGLCFVDVKL
ncbi:hypothetical protein EPI10_023110 [Gossypium australe]|uniref:Uncharacterized protein n=1 Tax=Gossypium australe TaxID=47621 RepID=A0A5B6VU68_9ROSI|nr:hypothetical protein EPI10_023110 [Gossypium australe]